MYGYIERYMVSQRDGWIDRKIYGQRERYMDRERHIWINRYIKGEIQRQTDKQKVKIVIQIDKQRIDG